MKPGCVPHRSMTLHWNSLPDSAALPLPNSTLCFHISLKLLPVVEHEYCGYWVKAMARSTPSRFISSRHVSVSGLA